MRVVLISDLSLNDQNSGAHARIACYWEMLRDSNINFVFSTYLNKDIFISYDDIRKLSYPIKETLFSKFYSNILKEFDFWGAIMYFYSIKKSTDRCRDALLLYPFSFSSSLVFLLLARLNRYQIIVEKNELELGILLNTSSPNGLNKKLLFFIRFAILMPVKILHDMSHLLANKVIAISKKMQKLYSVTGKNVIYLPILVSTNSRTSNSTKPESDRYKLVFTGSVADKKDNLFSVIRLIGEVAEFKQKFSLDIFGPCNSSSKATISSLVASYQLEGIVNLHGVVPNKDIPNILISADLLLLLRPSTLQNEFGFSTKLAEYLLSGKPVLTTDVSDNPLYLKDGINSILISKSCVSIDNIKRALLFFMHNPSAVSQIGQNGKMTAIQYFTTGKHRLRLNNFLREI